MATTIFQNQPVTFDLELARDESVVIPTLNPMQGDSNAPFQFRVVRSGAPVDLTNTTITFKGLDADGVPKVDTQPANGTRLGSGYAIFNFNLQDFKAAGQFKQAFFVISKGDEIVATIEISINVRENQVDIASGNQAFASEYEKYLQAYIDKVTKLSTDVVNIQDALSKADFYTKNQSDSRYLNKSAGSERVDSSVAFSNDVTIRGTNVIDAINNLMAGQESQVWKSDGVTLLNGVTAKTGRMPQYGLQKLGNIYLIAFTGTIKNFTVTTTNAPIPVVKFPDLLPVNISNNIALGYMQKYGDTYNEFLTWHYDEYTRTLQLKNFNTKLVTPDTELPISILYICEEQ